MKLINRGILVMKPNQLFLDWLNQLPFRDTGLMPYSLYDIRMDCTAVLLPDVVSGGSIDYILEPIKANLFEMELSDWCPDPSYWPAERSSENFDLWFDLEYHSMVWDLLDLPIQAADEDQDFDPLMDGYTEDDIPSPVVLSDFEPDLPFKRQDSVTVRSGTTEPGQPQNQIGGWQGRVIDFIEGENGQIQSLVEWDSYTLEEMPLEFINQRADHTWDWETTAVSINDLELTKPRDNYHRVERVQAKLSALHFWPLIPSAGERIAQFLLNLDPSDDRSIFTAWHEQFLTIINFPFEACVERNSPGSPVLKGDFLTVTGLNPFDPLTGVNGKAKLRNQLVQIPLANLIVLNEKSSNHQWIEDYKLWFDYTL